MLKINKKVEYALMSLKFMTSKKDDELTSAREICDELHIPFDTTSKVLQMMNNQSILSSVKGIKGGYAISKDLKEISYSDLTKLIEGKQNEENFCQSKRGRCSLYENCNIINPVEELNKKLNQFLEAVTLHDLLLTKQFNNQENA